MTGSLDGVRRKMDRASEHYDLFEKEVRDFFGSYPYAVRSDVDVQSGQKVFRIDGQPDEPPPRLSLIIGDAIQNLRSALDHLAWQLVCANGGTPGNRIAFPIFLKQKLFEDKRTAIKWEGMSAAAIARIKDLQPCYGLHPARDEVLWSLEELNNLDKHRRLYLTVIHQIGGIWDPPLPFGESRWAIRGGAIKDGAILATLPIEYVHVNFFPAMQVSFSDISPADPDDAVVSVLFLDARDYVTEIVDDFAFLPEFS